MSIEIPDLIEIGIERHTEHADWAHLLRSLLDMKQLLEGGERRCFGTMKVQKCLGYKNLFSNNMEFR